MVVDVSPVVNNTVDCSSMRPRSGCHCPIEEIRCSLMASHRRDHLAGEVSSAGWFAEVRAPLGISMFGESASAFLGIPRGDHGLERGAL